MRRGWKRVSGWFPRPRSVLMTMMAAGLGVACGRTATDPYGAPGHGASSGVGGATSGGEEPAPLPPPPIEKGHSSVRSLSVGCRTYLQARPSRTPTTTGEPWTSASPSCARSTGPAGAIAGEPTSPDSSATAPRGCTLRPGWCFRDGAPRTGIPRSIHHATPSTPHGVLGQAQRRLWWRPPGPCKRSSVVHTDLGAGAATESAATRGRARSITPSRCRLGRREAPPSGRAACSGASLVSGDRRVPLGASLVRNALGCRGPAWLRRLVLCWARLTARACSSR